MKLQDKLQEIKDEVAVKHGYIHWKKLMYSMGRSAIEQYENEAMITFAAYCCERQRESDAEKAKTKDEKLITGQVWPMFYTKTVVDKSSILNNKLITDHYDN